MFKRQVPVQNKLVVAIVSALFLSLSAHAGLLGAGGVATGLTGSVGGNMNSRMGAGAPMHSATMNAANVNAVTGTATSAAAQASAQNRAQSVFSARNAGSMAAELAGEASGNANANATGAVTSIRKPQISGNGMASGSVWGSAQASNRDASVSGGAAAETSFGN